MMRSRFTEEQIIAILREQEAGANTGDVCRRHGISEATFYAWKAKFGGLDVSEARRLKALEEENTKLKKLLADAMLDNVALKDLLAKNVWSAPSVQGSWSSDDDSSRKCIRPLASGLLLQPGHDEIRAHRSQINGSCKSTLFWTELTTRRSTVSSSFPRASQSAERLLKRRRRGCAAHREHPVGSESPRRCGRPSPRALR